MDTINMIAIILFLILVVFTIILFHISAFNDNVMALCRSVDRLIRLRENESD